jgi:hypothetical protein
MTKNEVKMLLDYGFSVSEIAEMGKTPAPTQDPKQDPKPDPKQDPKPDLKQDPKPDEVSNRDLLAAVTRLTNMMAMSNIRNTTISNPEPDVTAQLNSLFAAPPTQQK